MDGFTIEHFHPRSQRSFESWPFFGWVVLSTAKNLHPRCTGDFFQRNPWFLSVGLFKPSQGYEAVVFNVSLNMFLITGLCITPKNRDLWLIFDCQNFLSSLPTSRFANPSQLQITPWDVDRRSWTAFRCMAAWPFQVLWVRPIVLWCNFSPSVAWRKKPMGLSQAWCDVCQKGEEKLTLRETNSKFAPENRPGPKRKLIFQSSVFRCYVSFTEGI